MIFTGETRGRGLAASIVILRVEYAISKFPNHESAIDAPPGRAGRYSPVGRSLDGFFRLKKNRFVVRLRVCQRDEPAIRSTLAEYHLVWAPKYRKWVLRGDIRERVEELFRDVGEGHDIEFDTMEIASDHVHLFVSFPPRLSISEVVGKRKAVSAKHIFEEFPEVKREMYGGEPKARWILCPDGRG